MLARNFWNSQASWSRETFGSDEERGPKGPLLHLQKEVKEALDAVKFLSDDDKNHLQEEIVDCQFLVFDAARRSGLTFDEFFQLCFEKLEENKKRKWAKPITDEPVEHDRSFDKRKGCLCGTTSMTDCPIHGK